MLKRTQISFAVPGQLDVFEPQFKVLIDGKQYGHAIETPKGWKFYALGGGWLDGTAATLWELVDVIIVDEHKRFGHMTYNNQEKDNMSKTQTHNLFKVFTGDVDPVDGLTARVAAFASEHAAKSIGVEYRESAKKLVVTLGYRKDEAAYPVKLHVKPLGKIEGYGENDDYTALEAAMGVAADSVSNVICHELYIVDDGSFFMVLLARE